MARRRSLAKVLHIGEIDDDELSIVLTSALPRGAQFLGNEVEYRTDTDDLALTLVYRDGRVADAYEGPASSAELEAELEAKIEAELLGPTERKVCRWTMFSGHPVEGAWRYGDELQIVPAPPQAPRPEAVFADHPFVLDFVFDNSPNWQVRQLRYSRKAYELTLVLDLLLISRISTISNRGEHRWVYGPFDPTTETHPSVMWVQDGYFIADFTYLVDALPDDAADAKLAEIEADRYYNPYDFDARSDVLTVPAEFERLLDLFRTLSGDKRERFLRACYWHHMAGSIWNQSQSLHLASLINAVECLASTGPERSSPDGPTKLFKTFMKQHAPGAPSGTKVDQLYEARSHITHGERLLHYDQPPGASMLTQQSTADRQAGDDATLLCKGALINWLWAQQQEPAAPLIKQGFRRQRPARAGTKSTAKIIVPEGSD